MPDNRRRSARIDHGPLPGDARKRRRERQRRDARRARAGIGIFVVVGMLALGLVAGLAATAAFIDNLPKLSRLGPVALGENSSVYARDCTRKPCQDEALGVIARTENRISVRWKDIAPTMRSATVAIEDRRYWEHGALDWHGIARAAINNLQAGGIRQGGSTISQQLAKNLYLQRQASSRSLSRKLDEAWIAVQLQDKYTKAEILTAYLNTVFYGESAYGVEAAAHTYFDRTAKQLTLAQSALLAGLPQAPSAYNPFIHPAAAQKRRGEVLSAMRELRWISADAYATAVNAPLGLKRGQLRHAVVLAVRVRPGAPGAQRPPAGQAGRARRAARVLDGRPAAAVRGTAGDQGRAQDAGRPLGRARRDQRPQRQRARARHLGLRLGERTSSTSRPPATARRARRSSSSRSSTRCAAVPTRRGSTTRRATSRSPRTIRCARTPAAGRRTTPTAAAAAT